MDGWSASTLGEVVEAGGGEIKTGPFGSQLHESDYVADLDAVVLVMPKDMVDRRINRSSAARISREKANELRQHITHDRDILLPRRGDLGRHVLVRDQDAGAFCGSGSLRVRLGSGPLMPEFLSYMLATDQGRQQLESKASGVTMPNISTAAVRELEIEFPEWRNQEAIVSVLDAYSELLENNVRRIEILEEMAQAIYREWFVNFRFPGHANNSRDSDALPESWAAVRLDEVVDIVRGRSYRKFEVPDSGGVPFFNLKCINRGGGFRKSGLKRYTGRYKPGQETRPGDIVVAVTDMTQERNVVARAARIPQFSEDFGVISLDLARLVPKAINREYLYGTVRYSDFPETVKNYANGANVLHLSPDRIAEYRMALPPTNLQDTYSQFVRPIYRLADDLDLQIENLRATRDFLLPKLISGEIDVSELDIDTSWLAA